MSVLLVLTSVQVQIIVTILKEAMNANVHMAMSYLQKFLIDVKVYNFIYSCSMPKFSIF